MMNSIFRAVRRAARWLLRNHREGLDVPKIIVDFRSKVDEMLRQTSRLLATDQLASKRNTVKQYQDAGVSKTLANKIASYRYLSHVFDIIDTGNRSKISLKLIAEVYHQLTSRLSLGWMRSELSQMRDQGYWELLAGSSLRDDLDRVQSDLTVSVIRETKNNLSAKKRVEEWMDHYNFLICRWIYMVESLKTVSHQFTQYYAVVRALIDLVQVCNVAEKPTLNSN